MSFKKRERKIPRELPCTFHHVRPRWEDGQLLNQEPALSRHWICLILVLGLLGLRKCEEIFSFLLSFFAYWSPSLWRFCYSSRGTKTAPVKGGCMALHVAWGCRQSLRWPPSCLVQSRLWYNMLCSHLLCHFKCGSAFLHFLFVTSSSGTSSDCLF